MARNHYKITFGNRVVIYTTVVGNVNSLGSSVPVRVIDEQQMELMNLMLLDLNNVSFSCSEEEFYARLTPNTLKGFRELRSNVFKVKKHEESINVLESGGYSK